jgi:NADH-quinone oxidoreductase subunit J
MDNTLLMQVLFTVLTIITLFGGVGVVISNNLFHSALYLVLSFAGVAGYYVLLSAGVLAVVQLMVYIGAVAILILFAIMLSRHMMSPDEGQVNEQYPWAMIASLLLFGALMFVVTTATWPVSGTAPTGDAVKQLGEAFLGSYLIPFEVVSVLLSVALIGAVILAREKTKAEEAQS